MVQKKSELFKIIAWILGIMLLSIVAVFILWVIINSR
jgi:uncharacterized protein involved in outer membrane biogenesis